MTASDHIHHGDTPGCATCTAIDETAARIGEVADAALVVDGSADDIIADLTAQGWTWDGTSETLHGKRIRVLVPPPGWGQQDEEDGDPFACTATGGDHDMAYEPGHYPTCRTCGAEFLDEEPTP